MNSEIFGVIASIISIVAFIPYILSIFRKETKPSGPSWWIWTLLTGITVISSKFAGAPWQILILPSWLFFSQFFVAVLSIKYGDNNWDWINKACIGGGVVGIILWVITGQPLIALAFSIVADLCASIPNFRHIAKNPQFENKLGWFLGWLSSVSEVLAVPYVSIVTLAFPLYFLINMTTNLILVFSPILNKKR